MHIIEIPSLKRALYIPEDLSECNPKQYIDMSSLILAYHTGQRTYEDIKVQALYRLLEMKPINQKEADQEKDAKVTLLADLIDSFREEVDGENLIKLYFVKNPMPKLKGFFLDYYGPEDEFNDVTFGEYLDALDAYIDFNQTGEFVYLHQLLAIFYRKKFLKKEAYNPQTVSKRAEFFRHQPPGVLYGFYLYFASMQKYIASAKLFISGNEIDLSVLFDEPRIKQAESKLKGIGMRSVLYTLAESGVYGNIDKVRDKPLWEILVRLYDITKRNEDEKVRQKQEQK